MEEKQEYKTTDIALAASLKIKDYAYTIKIKDRGIGHFYFNDVKKEDIEEFYTDRYKFLSFTNAIKDLKRQIKATPNLYRNGGEK